jgi:hypothetical protein
MREILHSQAGEQFRLQRQEGLFVQDDRAVERVPASRAGGLVRSG